MLLPIKAICKANKVRKNGTSPIYIQYCLDSRRRTLLNTGFSIPPKFWNGKKMFVTSSLPPEYADAGTLNGQIRIMLRKVEDIISIAQRSQIDDPIPLLNHYFPMDIDLDKIEQGIRETKLKSEAQNPTTNLDVYFQIDEYIKSKANKVTPGMLRIYRNMKDHLKAFENYRKEKISFDSFDLNFYESFVDFLAYDYIQRRRIDQIRGLKTNTIGKTIKQLRIFLRNRMRKKIIPIVDIDDFKILEEEVDAIYLNREEINKIYQLNLTKHPHLKDYRNLLVLGCLTGLRFSDFSSIDPCDVRNGMLYKKQGKSDSWVVIPLRKEAAALFENEFKKSIPVLSNPEFNRHIKTIGRLADISEKIRFSHKKGHKDIVTVKPKHDWITSHTCRRSFCTNEFLAGTPVELIMKISGHKSVRDFYRYIRITPEEAGQKIKEIWEQRGEMEILQKDIAR